jgi:hypothetical protein
VNVAGIRAFSGGAPPVVGAPGFVVVSGAVGGAPVAVGGAICVKVAVALAVAVVVVVVVDRDVPHPTALISNTTHKRSALHLTFAG